MKLDRYCTKYLSTSSQNFNTFTPLPTIGRHCNSIIIQTLSYIPLISLIVGISRVILASQRTKEYKKHIVRGVVECLQVFCIILLIVDIYAACLSNTKKKRGTSYETLLSNFLSSPTIYPPSVITFKPTTNKQLIYIATHHTNDIDSSVAKTIKNVIESEQPDFCILEGFTTTEGINPERIIEIAKKKYSEGRCGENCYAVNFCQKHHINFIGGDVDEKTYLDFFKQFGISQMDIVFFLLAQQIPLWHRDREFLNTNLKEQFENFMQEAISNWLGIPSVKYTYEDFLAWHKDKTGKSYNPDNDFLWDIDSRELRPYLGENATIYQKICAYTIYIRDKNIIQLIEKMMAKHSKVLIVYGSTHYKNQAQILERLYGKPNIILLT